MKLREIYIKQREARFSAMNSERGRQNPPGCGNPSNPLSKNWCFGAPITRNPTFL